MHPTHRTVKLGLVALLAGLVAAVPPAGAQPCGRQLLQNRDCEEPLVNGEIPGWTEVVGNDWTARSADPPPEPFSGGLAYFSPGNAAEAELSQDVTFDGLGDDGILCVHYQTGPKSPSDVVRMICEFRDTADGPVKYVIDSGERTAPGQWSYFCRNQTGDARHARIRLIASRRSGTTTDAWFDSAWFFIECPLPVTATTWSGVKALYR